MVRLPNPLVEFAASSAGWLSRRLGRGGGTTLPGAVLLRLRPDAIAEMAGRLDDGVVLISATNGKTTTTRLVVAAAQAAGHQVVTNAEGSNLERGIASALLADRGRSSLGIFEVDEAALEAVVAAADPRTVVLMNLFRDQLDRYGELDTLVERWRRVIGGLGADTDLVIDADDPNLVELGQGHATTIWFGIDDLAQDRGGLAHAADATTCRRCGHQLEHDAVFVGHLGHWRCPNGDAARPAADVSARSVNLDPSAEPGQTPELREPGETPQPREPGQTPELREPGETPELRVPGETAVPGRLGQIVEMAVMRPVDGPVGGDRTESDSIRVTSRLAGLHNTYNLTAAMAAAVSIGVAPAVAARAFESTAPAFGRGEQITVGDCTLNLLLAKNPTGVNQNIATVAPPGAAPHLLVLLNDRTADGQDVSWIWDVDWEPLAGRLGGLTIGGDRAWDMALRFRYGGFDMSDVAVETDIGAALDVARAATPAGETLHALATYTAMLDLRAELTERGHTVAYWEQAS